MIHGHAIGATCRRQLYALLSNPLAYVFILAFVLATALIMFLGEDFYKRNIADFEPLRQYMLYPLVVLIPALAMGSWASERELGTEEQLLSLPMTIADVLFGKWLGIAAFFSITMIFSWCNVFILGYLGEPDIGLIVAHYVGWWFAGLFMVSLSMLASALVSMPAIAFVIGVIFSGLGAIALSGSGWLDPFYRGLVPVPSILMTVLLIAAPLAIAGVSLSMRRWQEKHASRFTNLVITCVAFCVVAFNVIILLDRLALDVDITEERLSSLSGASDKVLDGIERKVEIVAFISQELPNSQLANKASEVETMLQAIDRSAGSSVSVSIKRPSDALDETGVEATRHYGLEPRSVLDDNVAGREQVEVFLGAVVRSGSKTQTIGHFDPGLSVEYELIRAIRAVGQSEKRVVGIVDSSFKVEGGFDYQTRQMNRPWQVIEELKKQYEIRKVTLDSPVADDVSALLVVQASQLKEEEVRVLHDAIWSGKPTIILEDPLPNFSGANLASSQAGKAPKPNPFNPQQPPQPEPKGNLTPLFNALGLFYNKSDIIWSNFNPSHEFRNMPKDFIWTYRRDNGINGTSSIVTGIDGLLMLSPGSFEKTMGAGNEKLTIEPLVSVHPQASWGRVRFDQVIVQGFMGFQRQMPRYQISFGETPMIAVKVTGNMKRAYALPQTTDDKYEAKEAVDPNKGKGDLSEQAVNVVLIADTDFIHDQFYSIYRNENDNYSQEGLEVLQGLHNVQFIANAVDAAIGDEEFLSLRTRRPQMRPLTLLEESLRVERDHLIAAENAAIDEKEKAIKELNDRMKEKIDAIKNSTEDSNAKRQRLAQIQGIEERRLQRDIAAVDKSFSQKVKEAKIEMRRARQSELWQVLLMAVGLPSILLVMLIIVVFVVRIQGQQAAIPSDRQRSTP